MPNEALPDDAPMATDGSRSRELVAPDGLKRGIPPRAEAPLSGFLVQLIACRDGLPAYRQQRRGEAPEATARYAAASQTADREASRLALSL